MGLRSTRMQLRYRDARSRRKMKQDREALRWLNEERPLITNIALFNVSTVFRAITSDLLKTSWVHIKPRMQLSARIQFAHLSTPEEWFRLGVRHPNVPGALRVGPGGCKSGFAIALRHLSSA